jgi:hypothetical protein
MGSERSTDNKEERDNFHLVSSASRLAYAGSTSSNDRAGETFSATALRFAW